MKNLIYPLILIVAVTVACNPWNSLAPLDQLTIDQSATQPDKQGAIYISCETPPWSFNVEGLLACEQPSRAPLGLNPPFTCPMSGIQRALGEIEISYAQNSDFTRFLVRLTTSDNTVKIQALNGLEVKELLVADEEDFLLTKENETIVVHIVNSYVGGCFHELIRWESVN